MANGSDQGRPGRPKTTRMGLSRKKSTTRLPAVGSPREEQVKSGASRPLHEQVKTSATARLDQAAEKPATGKTTRSMPRRVGSDTQTDRTRRAVAAKKSNPVGLYLGIGGGVLLLIIVLAAASGSGGYTRRRKQAVKPPPPPAPVVAQKKKEKQDTGPITFVCAGGGVHPEMEQMWRRCPDCRAGAPFFWDYKANKFKCFGCKKLFAKDEIACEECGKKPLKPPYIKHRPK